MKFASFKYQSKNIGDQFQSFAAEQHLPRVDEQIERDFLGDLPGPDKHFVIMNGWFNQDPEPWPPSEALEPVFFGFHIGKNRKDNIRERYLQPDSVAYFKRFEPIGCRDRQTRDWLLEKGVDAYYSKCLTLTFPKREKVPKDGKIFLVDVFSYYPLPKYLRKKGVIVGHGISNILGDPVKRTVAKRVLEVYRDEAALVVTSRLHAAMPCIAMGIPVVYLGTPGDYRTSILEDIGLPVHEYKKPKNKLIAQLKRRFYEAFSLGYLKQDIWNPPPLEIEEEKAKIIEGVRHSVNERLKALATEPTI